MKKSTIFIVLAVLCLKFTSRAQSSEPFSSKSRLTPQLEIGAKLPESFWTDNHTFRKNGKDVKKNLTTAKGKIVILDFWAIWCTSCLHKLPILDSIRKAYPEEVAIFAVNSVYTQDKAENIDNVFSGKRKPFKSYSLPSIVQDSLLWKTFPHHVLSHVIWIQEGRILAMTSGDFISAEFIDRLVSEQRILNQKRKSKQP